MAQNKYIGTKDAVKLTGREYDEILNLAKTGVLPCHRTRRGHYRLNADAVEKYFGIQVNKHEEVSNNTSMKTDTVPCFTSICKKYFMKMERSL